MLQLGRRGKGNRIPNVVAAGTGATPAAFYLGLCRLRGILSPPASATVILQEGRSSAQLRWCCRRGVLSCSSDDAASIPKSGPEITNQCTKEGGNGENLASIRKSEPEIKNRCTNQPIFSTHPQHIPPARVHHALTTRLALDVLHGDSDAGSTVAAKAGADAPGGGISLCFCRRGCAAPAQKAATLNTPPPRNQPKPPRNRHPGTTPHCNKKVRPKSISRTINPNYYDAKL